MQAHLDEKLAQYCIAPGVYVVPNYSETVLNKNPATLLDELVTRYPVRGEGDAIQRDVVQWVDGDNAALRYRGHVLRRCKIWLQRGATATVGFLRYRYTGWQWRVLPATVDVAMCPEVAPVTDKYDVWCDQFGAPHANHYIITCYEDGRHSIGWHFDKPESIDANSLITVVKLGEHARPFALRRLGETMPFFCDVLAPGTAVIMTMAANLATQHSVPEVGRAGRSGSIVFRTIIESFTEAEVAAELAARAIPF
jgi:alkylated DNA repair dioxygenase AlkB